MVAMQKALALIEIQVKGTGKSAFGAGIHDNIVTSSIEAIIACTNRLIEQGIISGIKPVLNEKKIGYDWGTFTGITLKKDQDSAKVIEALKQIPEITECYYITGSFTLYIKMIAKDHEHMRKLLYEKIDSIPGISKTESLIELGCAFKRNISL